MPTDTFRFIRKFDEKSSVFDFCQMNSQMTINDTGAALFPNNILAIMEYRDTMVTEISHSLIEELVTVKSQLKADIRELKTEIHGTQMT